MERCEGAIEAIKKMIPRGLEKEQKEEMEAAEKVLAWLQEGKDIRFGDWSAREIEWLNEMQFIS